MTEKISSYNKLKIEIQRLHFLLGYHDGMEQRLKEKHHIEIKKMEYKEEGLKSTINQCVYHMDCTNNAHDRIVNLLIRSYEALSLNDLTIQQRDLFAEIKEELDNEGN